VSQARLRAARRTGRCEPWSNDRVAAAARDQSVLRK
jgi:hypothetical protein